MAMTTVECDCTEFSSTTRRFIITAALALCLIMVPLAAPAKHADGMDPATAPPAVFRPQPNIEYWALLPKRPADGGMLRLAVGTVVAYTLAAVVAILYWERPFSEFAAYRGADTLVVL